MGGGEAGLIEVLRRHPTNRTSGALFQHIRPMPGLNRTTGAMLSGFAHVQQSIGLLLTTPKMSRVMRRYLGADLPRKVDAPINQQSTIELFAAVASVMTYEPRFKVSRMRVDSAARGQIALMAEGVYYPNGASGDFSVSIPQTVTVTV